MNKYNLKYLFLLFIFAIYLRANFNEKMKNEPLIYGNNTMQINGKFLYFKEL